MNGVVKSSSGSALLIVMALMGLSSALVMHAWFITSLQYDIVQQRELWHKNFYAQELVLNVGLVQVSKQFDHIMHRVACSKQPLRIDLSPILGHDSLVLVTKSHGRVGEEGLIVRTGRLLCKLSKIVSEKEICFVVSHFTISTSI